MIIYPGGRLCGCGQRGCAEAYASARSTCVRLCERSGEQIGSVSAKDVFSRADRGDLAAKDVLAQTAEVLGILCVNLCRLVDPQVIILAGGMANAGQPLLDLMQAHLEQQTWSVLPTPVRLCLAQSIGDAGMLGAGLAALHCSVADHALSGSPMAENEVGEKGKENEKSSLLPLKVALAFVAGATLARLLSSKIECHR